MNEVSINEQEIPLYAALADLPYRRASTDFSYPASRRANFRCSAL